MGVYQQGLLVLSVDARMVFRYKKYIIMLLKAFREMRKAFLFPESKLALTHFMNLRNTDCIYLSTILTNIKNFYQQPCEIWQARDIMLQSF